MTFDRPRPWRLPPPPPSPPRPLAAHSYNASPMDEEHRSAIGPEIGPYRTQAAENTEKSIGPETSLPEMRFYSPVTWDRTRARNQSRALRSALGDERTESYSSGCGEALLAAEVASLGDLVSQLSPETTWQARTSWRIGHHAGRLFALREARHDSTCTECPHRRTCEHEGDPYNTHGDCLASK